MNKVEKQRAGQQSYYDAHFSGYKNYQLENWRLAYLRRIFELLRMNPKTMKRGFRFLDVGVGGSGYTVIEAARMGAEGWGVDLSLVGVETARRLAKETLGGSALKRCGFKQATAEKLPFPDNYFDAISSIHVIEHIVDDRGAMSEMLRVTKPGGLCLIDTPHSYSKTPWIILPMVLVIDRQVGHLRHYSRAALAEIMGGLGAETLHTVYHAHLSKLWQNLLGMVLPSMKDPKSKLWWKLEEMDHEAKDDDSAAMITMVFRKNRKKSKNGVK